MDSRVLLVAIVVLVSGCAHTTGGQNDDSGGGGEGLVVERFGISDQQLAPGQSAIVRLRLKNYNTQPTDIDVESLSLYNTGFLEVGDRSCSPESIGQARQGIAPQMECSWEVTAPESLGGFESRAVSMNLNLRYRTALTNEQEAMEVSFRSLEDIRNRQQVTRTYSNGEVTATVSLENPAPLEGGIASFSFSSVGPGRVVSDYSISYRPSSLFTGCPENREPVTDGATEFTCELSADSSSTRNLVFSTSYKYVKSPSLDVEVARP